MPRYYIPKEYFKIVPKEKIDKYLEATDDEEFKTLLKLVWLTGARLTEIIELKYDNFTITRDGIIINIKAKKHGKVGYPSFSFEDPYVKDVLDFIERRKEFDRIFRRGKRRYQQILLDLNRKIYGDNTKEYITFHYLRHSRITFLARKLGALPEELKGWTGHRSIAFEAYFAPRRVARFKGKIR